MSLYLAAIITLSLGILVYQVSRIVNAAERSAKALENLYRL